MRPPTSGADSHFDQQASLGVGSSAVVLYFFKFQMMHCKVLFEMLKASETFFTFFLILNAHFRI